ncbi:histidine kinase [uncultured Winogradskyella sp.]|uniref:histidine kinase n=1 Tax=uncultured Winogradskyella sp. TaxID=395353 RepID=UPI002638E733|nr:histidine kinase [uncultured Winogradskyella sp.]
MIRIVLFVIIVSFHFYATAQQYSAVKYLGSEIGLPSDLVYEIIEDKQGYIWIATDNGVVKYNGTSFKVFQKKDGLLSNDIFEISQDSKGRIWLTGYYKGLSYIQNDKIYTLFKNEFENGLSFVEEQKDTLFFRKIHDSKRYYYLPQSNQLKPYPVKPNVPLHEGLKRKEKQYQLKKRNDTTNSIYFSKKNENHFDKKHILNNDLTQKFTNLNIDFHNANRILEDSYGNFWVISDINELIFIPKEFYKIYQIASQELFSDQVVFFKYAIKNQNKIYFITNTNMFYAYNIETYKLLLISDLAQKIPHKISKYENGILISCYKEIIQYNYLNGQLAETISVKTAPSRNLDTHKDMAYYIKGSTLTEYPSNRNILNLKTNLRVNNLSISANDNIIVSNEEAIFKINPLTKHQLINDTIKNISSLGHYKDYVLAGTYSEGLFILNKQLQLHQKISLKESVSSIISDHKMQRLYVGTSRAIHMYRYNSKGFSKERIINTYDGLGKGSLNNMLIDDNSIIYCNKKTITILDNNYDTQPINGIIEIEAVYNTDSIYNHNTTFSISRSNNNLSIKNSIHTFNNPANFETFYTLTKDETISEKMMFNNSVLTFNSLMPGNYTLKLFAKQVGNDETLSHKSISFIIAPYFYETISFKILMILILLFIASVVIIFYVKQLKRKHNTLVKINTLESRALSAQVNPHFVFNALNGIQSVLFLKGEQATNKYISMFSKLLRINFSLDNTNLIAIEDEIDFLKSYIQIEKMRLGDNLDVVFDVDSEVKKIKIPCMLLYVFK